MLSQPARLDDKAVAECQQTLAQWLAEDTLAHAELTSALESPGAIALALLLASQPDAPEKTVANWRESPPWTDDAALPMAFDRTQWQQ